MKTSIQTSGASHDSLSSASSLVSRRHRGSVLAAQAALVLSALALSGCQAGVDSDDDEDTEGTAQWAVTSCGTLSGDDATVNTKLSGFRSSMGLPAAQCDNKVRAAARAHSNYQNSKNLMTHQETDTSNQYYTGQWPWDRMVHQGYSWWGAGENVSSGQSTAGAAFNTWRDSVFHRVPLMDYKTIVYGYGKTNTKHTMDFDAPSSAAAPPANKQWFYPTNGLTGVPKSFACASEGGSVAGENACPAGGASPSGYPVSLVTSGTLVVKKALFRKSGAASSVPFSIEASSNTSVTCANGCDGQTKLSKGSLPEKVVVLVPKSALSATSTYNITIAGTDGGTAFTKTFSFTTGS